MLWSFHAWPVKITISCEGHDRPSFRKTWPVSEVQPRFLWCSLNAQWFLRWELVAGDPGSMISIGFCVEIMACIEQLPRKEDYTVSWTCDVCHGHGFDIPKSKNNMGKSSEIYAGNGMYICWIFTYPQTGWWMLKPSQFAPLLNNFCLIDLT